MKIKMIVASMVLAFTLSACSPSPDDINGLVKESLQETLSTDADYAKYNLRVGNIDLIEVSDSQYKALAEIYLDDELNIVPLDIYVYYTKGDISEAPLTWEAQPDAFSFINEK